MIDDSRTALWLTVVALGVYHGVNPAMGWPLAVANGLTARRGIAVFATLVPLGTGHLLAMALALLPFALVSELMRNGQAVRVVAGAAVLLFGLYRLFDRRHPRYLARIPPTQLAWWSFVMATAHGAGLMLVPVALGLCAAPLVPASDAGALESLMRSSLATAIGVTLVHTAAMLVSGVAIAWLVYRYLGLQFLRRAWFNLDLVWGASLVVAGGVSVAAALWLPSH
ncbi:MAG: hypothetical protein ABIQ60_13070 [Burkholderiaceae bacterium]